MPSSVQFSLSVVSNSLQPHGLQHSRPPSPSPSPGVYPNSCPLSQWCHSTISSFVVPFSSHPQSFPVSGSFPVSRFFTSRSWNWSFNFSISPSNEYSGLISFRMDWLDLLAVQGTLKSLLQHHSSKASVLWHSAFFMVQHSHPYMTTGKIIALTRKTNVGKVMSLLFNMLSRLVIAFLPRSKCLLISWLQSPSAVILEPKKIKSATVSIISPSICHEVMGPDAMILIFECWVLSQVFHSLLSLSSRDSLVPLHFLPKCGVICIAEVDISLCNLDSSCVSSSLAFHMMYSAYKLNSRLTIYSFDVLLSHWNRPIVPCPVLTVASWPAYRFLRR